MKCEYTVSLDDYPQNFEVTVSLTSVADLWMVTDLHMVKVRDDDSCYPVTSILDPAVKRKLVEAILAHENDWDTPHRVFTKETVI